MMPSAEPLDQGGDLMVQGFLVRAAETMGSRLIGGSPVSFFVFGVMGVSTASEIPRTLIVRKRRPICAGGLPFSTSTIHCLPTPADL